MGWSATILACAMMVIASCCTTSHAGKKEACVSSCGLLFEGTSNGAMSCDQLQEAEDVTLKVMNDDHCKDDPRMCKKAACDSMFGYQIWTEDTDAIVFITGDEVIGPFDGITNPNSKTITLARHEDWREGAIPHELVHVMQGGLTPKGWKETDSEKSLGVGHAGWTDHGIYKSIEDIRKGRK